MKWRSPMHLQLAAKDMQDAKKVVPGICLEVVGKPRPILEMMASVCFHGIPEAGLMKLIRHLGRDATEPVSVHQTGNPAQGDSGVL